MTKAQLNKLEADPWRAADNLRQGSDLKSSQYANPVLGIIFLRFADNNYRRHEAAIHAEFAKLKGTRCERPISETPSDGLPATYNRRNLRDLHK